MFKSKALPYSIRCIISCYDDGTPSNSQLRPRQVGSTSVFNNSYLEFCRIVAHPRVLEWTGITDDTNEFYDSFYDEMDSYDAIATYYDS